MYKLRNMYMLKPPLPFLTGLKCALDRVSTPSHYKIKKESQNGCLDYDLRLPHHCFHTLFQIWVNANAFFGVN